ncbi:MAG TPA: succinylglutamate desuccinylase/aspartoacylase family protein [Thermomicrobiaceae bacterium]|nr:succinylglutamate desuccinylase/aspartoacylase family protein [Thermomicrobiaceae bacterium]
MASNEPLLAARGERHEGTLTSDLAVLRGWEWPYVTINGAHDGPRATITAGIHGCEYVSIRAAVRLARELDPAEVHGQILVVPIVNLPSFWERTAFFNPYDGKNLNRVFPGKATGTFCEALAYFIFNTCITWGQAYVDLHGGDMVEELLPFTGYATNAAPEVSDLARRMAEAFGLPFANGRVADPNAQGTMTYVAAAQAGVAGLLAEAGGIGQLTLADVDLLVDGTRRALQAAGNLPGEPRSPGTTHVERSQTMVSPAAGFWICDVRAGDSVRQGQTVGHILSLLGDVIETVQAPFDGTVLYRTTSAAVKENGILLSIVA